VILPILFNSIKKYKGFISTPDFMPLLKQNIKYSRSDAICWTLSLMGMYEQKVNNEIVIGLTESEDCMSIAMLISLNQHQDKIIEFIKRLDSSDYDYDKYWILIYELMDELKQIDKLSKYIEESKFSILKNESVRFIEPIKNQLSE
jgi:hypothetical protein